MTVTSALRDITLLYVAWMCVLGTNAGSCEPVYVWPFSNLTYAYEVMLGGKGEYSDNQKCPELESGHSYFDYETIVFKGSGPYFEVEMKRTKLVDSITFAFYVFPYDLLGIILDYQADDDSKADRINKLIIELANDGRVKVTVAYWNNGINGWDSILSPPHFVSLTTWTFIAFSKDSEKMYLQVNENRQEETKNSMRLRFDARGDIDIGKGIWNTKAYEGSISCLSFWECKMLSMSEIKQWCSPKKWRQKPSYSTPKCAVQPANAKVTHLWPLSLSSSGYNVVNNVEPTARLQFQCSFTSRDTYRETNQTVIYLDGSIISYLQAIIPITNANSDITVAIAVKPDHQVEGVIWDIQIPAPLDTDHSWQLRLSLVNRSAVFEIRNATGTCSQVTSKNRIHGDGWYFLCAMLLLSNNTMSFFSEGQFESTPLGCKPNFGPLRVSFFKDNYLGIRIKELAPSIDKHLYATATTDTAGYFLHPTSKSASIRVGQAHDTPPATVGYHGSAACLALVDGVADGASIQVLVEKQCKDLDKVNPSVVNASCSNSGIKIRRYRMAAHEQCPHTEWSAPMPTFSGLSLVTCSTECMSEPHCRSFAFRTTNSTNNCQMYNFVTRSGLHDEQGCNYYCLAVG